MVLGHAFFTAVVHQPQVKLSVSVPLLRPHFSTILRQLCGPGPCRQPVGVDQPQAQLSSCEPLLGIFSVQFCGFSVVLGHAFTVAVIHPQVRSSACVPLLGSFSVPFYGFSVVLGPAVTVVVIHPQVKLSDCVPLLGRFSVPFCGFRVVLGHAFFTAVVHQPQEKLGVCVPLFGRFSMTILPAFLWSWVTPLPKSYFGPGKIGRLRALVRPLAGTILRLFCGFGPRRHLGRTSALG